MNSLQWLCDVFLPVSNADKSIFEQKMDPPNIIRFDNGIYDLLTGTFLPSANEYNRTTTGYDYQEYADDAPEIIEIYDHLSKLFPNQQDRNRCLMLLSNCLDGRRHRSNILMFFGSGSNGKTFLRKLCQATFGNYMGGMDIPPILDEYDYANYDTFVEACEKMKMPNIDKSYVVWLMQRCNFKIGQINNDGDDDIDRFLYVLKNTSDPAMNINYIYECNQLPEVNFDLMQVIEFKSQFMKDPIEPYQFLANRYIIDDIPRLAPAFMYILIEHNISIF